MGGQRGCVCEVWEDRRGCVCEDRGGVYVRTERGVYVRYGRTEGVCM